MRRKVFARYGRGCHHCGGYATDVDHLVPTPPVGRFPDVSSAANAELIHNFYDAFGRRDAGAMAACYAPDATFSDPVFTDLHGEEVTGMWRLLTSRATDLEVELAEHAAGEATGTARWVATYTFTRTGRPVVNEVRAAFRFRDGLIGEHVDSFSFWGWSRQALGTSGLVLGWSPLLRAAVSRRAKADLHAFLEST